MPQLDLVQDLAIVLVCAGAAAWICQRFGISVVVGYLLAGILVGPFTLPTPLVQDVENVEHLANLGLIFVMFFVGLELSLPRLKALGIPALAATAITALTVLIIGRFVATGLGLGFAGGLFLGGTLVVSSSAIIDKVLTEIDARHEPAGRLAMGITVLEDLVAVVMLAILGSVTVASADEPPHILALLGSMGAFVLVVLVVSLLVVPKILRVMGKTASVDVRMVLVAGILLAMAWVAAWAGYSIALGAFLLGSALGGTQHKAGLERAFSPVRDLFAAVFFVSMGMLFDVGIVVDSWPWVLALTGFALLVRFFAATLALVVVGQPVGYGAQVGLSLLPLGEFSFVIAQLGVSSGLMPKAFYPATVGAALVTTLISPALIRRGPGVGQWLGDREPRLLRAWRTFLDNAAASFLRRGEQRPLLRLLGGQALRLAGEATVVVSAVALSRIVFEALDAAVAGHALQRWLPLVYWAAFGGLLLVPLLALWRGLGALGMMLGDVVGEGGGQAARRMAPLVARAVQVGGAIVVLLLCATFLPSRAAQPWMLLLFSVVAAALVLFLRGRLVRWFAQAQVELRENLAAVPAAAAISPGAAERTRPILKAPFGLLVREHTLGDLSPAAGRTVADTGLRQRFGCTLAGVDRQGITIAAPGADFALYPNDRLLLVGTADQLDQAEEWLSSEEPRRAGDYRELTTDQVQVPDDAPYAGQTLRELQVASRFGVQVLGIARHGHAIDVASGEATVRPGDWLFVLGTDPQNRAFREWMARR
jgi:CPA2 family monovalent cation:H+ antiporter-2